MSTCAKCCPIMGNKLLAPPKRYVNNPNDRIGDKKKLLKACIWKGGIGKHQIRNLLPTNGEYGYHSQSGSCASCVFNAPQMREHPTGLGVPGNIPYIKRVTYTAPEDVCCRTTNKTINGKTCDPKYRGPSASGCKEFYREYCATGDRITSDTRCQEFADAYPSESFNLMKLRCQDDPMDPNCELWANTGSEALGYHKQAFGKALTADILGRDSQARRLAKKYRGTVDDAVIDYCMRSTHNKKFCACANTPIPITSGNPECMDLNCSQHGYHFRTQPPQCPDRVDCNVYFDLKDIADSGQIIFRDANVSQRCGNAPTSGGDKSSGGTQSVDHEDEDADEDDKADYDILKDPLLYLGVGALGVGALGLIVYGMKK